MPKASLGPASLWRRQCRLKLINTQRYCLVGEVQFGDDSIPEVSINDGFIIVGTEKGIVGLRDYTGAHRFHFESKSYVRV